MRCPESGKVYDDSYRPYHYRDGVDVVPCPRCNAKRKLQKVKRALGPRGTGISETMLIYPYHQVVR